MTNDVTLEQTETGYKATGKLPYFEIRDIGYNNALLLKLNISKPIIDANGFLLTIKSYNRRDETAEPETEAFNKQAFGGENYINLVLNGYCSKFIFTIEADGLKEEFTVMCEASVEAGYTYNVQNSLQIDNVTLTNETALTMNQGTRLPANFHTSKLFLQVSAFHPMCIT